MKTIYVKLLFVLVMILCIHLFQYKDQLFHVETDFSQKKEKTQYIVQVKTKTKTLKVKLDDYLVGVIAGEMPASFELEALSTSSSKSNFCIIKKVKS